MNNNIMRKVDYHLGIPICFIFSCIHKLSHLLPRKQKKKPRKVLFVKFFGLGTIVLATPALKRCMDLFPECDIHFLTFEENRGLFNVLNLGRKITVHTVRTTSAGAFATDVAKSIIRLRKENVDVVIDLEFFSRFTAILSFMLGAPTRVGFYNHYIEGLYRGDFLTHKVYYNLYQHTSLAFLDMVETIRDDAEFPWNKMHYSSLVLPEDIGVSHSASEEETRSFAAKFPVTSPLVLFNPNISEGFIDLRRWPLEHFSELARRIFHDYPSATIGIIGGKKDERLAEKLSGMIDDPRVVNFAGRTTLAELCILMDNASCLVTNDSGPAHLAALTGTSIITFFGPDTPVLFSPLSRRRADMFLNLGCSPCGSIYNGKRTVCRDNQCVKRITPEMVMAQLDKLFNNEGGRHEQQELRKCL